MKFGVRMLLAMGSICIVFGVRGTSNVEARGGRKLAKSKISKRSHNITIKICTMATQPSLSLNDQLLAVVPPRKWPHNFLFLKIINCCAILRNSQVFSCAIMKMASKLSFSQNNQLLRNIAQFSSFSFSERGPS